MKPWVVFGTGGDGRTWGGQAELVHSGRWDRCGSTDSWHAEDGAGSAPGKWRAETHNGPERVSQDAKLRYLVGLTLAHSDKARECGIQPGTANDGNTSDKATGHSHRPGQGTYSTPRLHGSAESMVLMCPSM